MKVAVPSWRPDIEGKADLVEEIVRIVGVDRVPSTPFDARRGAAQAGADPDPDAHAQGQAGARGARPGRGGDLVVHCQAAGRAVRRRHAELALANPIAADLSDMRPSLHARPCRRGAEERRPRLCRHRAVRGRPDFPRRPAGGSVHRRDRRPPRLWPRRAASAGTGRRGAPRRRFRREGRRARGAGAAGAPAQALQIVPGGPAWFHPGRSGTIQIGPQNVLGHFGELHPRALEALDAEGPLAAFEVILERIPEPRPKRRAPSRCSSSRRSSR